jgi:hypothetical protein
MHSQTPKTNAVPPVSKPKRNKKPAAVDVVVTVAGKLAAPDGVPEPVGLAVVSAVAHPVDLVVARVVEEGSPLSP